MASGDARAKDLQNKYKRISPCRILYKLVELLKNPVSTDLIDRQIYLLDDLLLGLPCGFWLQDLTFSTHLIEILFNKSKSNPVYQPYFVALLRLCYYPPLMTRANEILVKYQELDAFFSFMGYFYMIIDDKEYQGMILDALWGLLVRKKQFPMRGVSLRICQESIERSCLPEAFSNIIKICDEDYYRQILEICAEIAQISENICRRLLNERTLEIVMIRLDPEWRTRVSAKVEITDRVKYFDESFQIMTILLNTVTQLPDEQFPTPGLESGWAMRYALRSAVCKRHRKIKRNYIVAVIIMITDLFPEFRVFQAGIVEDFCTISNATEFGTGGTWASLFRFTTDAEDYELKRMLLVAIYYCSKQVGVDKLYEDKSIGLALLKLITPELKVFWCPGHLCKIRYTALNVLERLSEMFINEFNQNNGLFRILMLIECYLLEPFALDTLISALKCLYAFIKIKLTTEALDDICENNPEDTLRNLLKKLYSRELTTPSQTSMTLIFTIMKLLIGSEKMEWEKNVDLGIDFLKRMLHPREKDIRYDPRLVITLINYLWELGKKNDEYIIYFVKNNGVYHLLDVIKEAIFPVKLVALGFLVEIAEEGTGIPYLLTWRNKNSSLVPLLLQIFREENKLIGVKSLERGVIDDPLYPIMGILQKKTMLNEHPQHSPAITDMSYSCRPKLFAIMQFLNKMHKEKVEKTNDYYRLYGNDLTVDDKITLLTCDHYLIFKLGEAWMEVRRYIEAKNIEPVPFDKRLLDTMNKNFEKWGCTVKELQMELLKRENRNEHISEEEFYNTLREAKLGLSLRRIREFRHLAKSCEPSFRTKEKLQDSLIMEDFSHTHLTYNTLLNVSNIVGQKIFLESDFIIDPFAEVPPLPVSPSSSNDVLEYGDVDHSAISLVVPQFCVGEEAQDADKKKT